jgi:hypothetical protein
MRKLCTDEVGGVKIKKNGKKARFIVRKIVFSLLLFFACSFGFAFPTLYVELEKTFL